VLSRFAKVLLVLTAFAPVLLTFAFVQLRHDEFIPWGATGLIVAVLLALICLLVLKEAARQLEIVGARLISIKTADTEIVGYVLSYLVPLANLSSTDVDPWVLVFVAGFFLFIVATSHSYHFNPLMSVLGYHFFEVTDETGVSYVLITRRSLRVARMATRVVQLSEYILLDVEKTDGQ
jgi:hypothetical protein